MRNLKRALSLALASVMLLGMMVVGTSAASAKGFTDADEITNVEAVAIATGLGIFDGYTDGSFGPTKAVTRAEAAVVIAKILHGSDVNPANLAGAGKFTDVPAWAEGYVNLVSALKIIEGRGNGIFDPNATVTTVEFTTMLLKALGYYVDAETALNADWKLEVTSKANSLGLYGDLELGMNAPLSREDVAALTFNALFAQRVAYNDYRGQYVKATDRDVVVTNGTVDALNTLADNTFGLYSVEGIVLANGMTDESLSETLKSEAQTTVMFTDDTDLNKDGKVEFTYGDAYDFEIASDLDFIGHAVKVYYTIEKKAPVVFAMVDQATKVEVITYASNTTTLANRANDAGFKKNSILDYAVNDYIINYDVDATVASESFNTANLDTLIVISNSSNYTVDCVIALDQYLDTVATYEVDGDETTIALTTGGEGDDMTIAMGEVKKGDYVVVTDIGNQGDVLVFEAAELIPADITKITGKSVAVTGGNVKKVTADGVDYTVSSVDVTKRGQTALENTKAFAAIDVIGKATLIVDEFGKLIGLAEEKTLPNYVYVAQYGTKHVTSGLGTKNVLTALVYFADGTSGIYEVKDDGAFAATLPVADYSALVTELNRSNGQDVTATANAGTGATGLWNGTVSGDKIKLNTLATAVSGPKADDVKLVKGHSTLLKADGSNVTGFVDGNPLFQNNDTVYFYVNGNYDASKSNYGLTVKPVIGIKNAFGFTNDTATGTGIQQAFATDKARNVIDTMLIENVVIGGSNDVYYYNMGNYEVVAAETGKYTVTFYLNDVNGEATSVTYDNEGHYWTKVSDAKAEADQAASGYYKIGATELEPYALGTNVSEGNNKLDTIENVTYVIGANASYDEYTDNLFDDVATYGTITENTKVVDLTGNGLNTISKIVKALSAKNVAKGAAMQISYSFDKKTYETDVLYVISYTAPGTDAPNAGTVVTGDYAGTVTVTGNTVALACSAINGWSLNDAKVFIDVTVTTSAGLTKTVSYVSELGDVASYAGNNTTLSGLTLNNATSGNLYEIDVVMTFKGDDGKNYTVTGDWTSL